MAEWLTEQSVPRAGGTVPVPVPRRPTQETGEGEFHAVPHRPTRETGEGGGEFQFQFHVVQHRRLGRGEGSSSYSSTSSNTGGGEGAGEFQFQFHVVQHGRLPVPLPVSLASMFFSGGGASSSSSGPGSGRDCQRQFGVDVFREGVEFEFHFQFQFWAQVR